MPLILALLLTLSISGVTLYISKEFLLGQMKQNGFYHATQIAQQIENNNNYFETIDNMLNHKIIEAGTDAIRDQDKTNNLFLVGLAKDLGVGEINWYDGNGKIVYSNVPSYIGWVAPKGHPVIGFSENLLPTFVEKDVRQVTDYDLFFKYGYVRGKNGYFVQIGLPAKEVYNLTEKFSSQYLINNLINKDHIVYALIIDPQMKVTAHSEKAEIGLRYTDDEVLKEALTGKQVVREWYYDKKAVRVFDMAQPIFHNGKIIGAVNIGISMERVYAVIYIISSTSAIIAIILFLLFLGVQHKNITRPINRLDQCISAIDMENHIEYRLPIVKGDTFYGLGISINNILSKTQESFRQLKEKQQKLTRANEELSMAYEQLTAAKEELRNQYDEIQNYADKLEYNADHDHLTNLPNRRKLMYQLEYTMSNNQPGALILLDIDNFKGINDTRGHNYGDQVLRKVAEEFQKLKNENIFIARLGGDEFCILIQGEERHAIIEEYAKKIITLFNNKLIIEKEEIRLSCSMGITRYPFDSHKVSQLLMNADMAMYQVKNAGKNNYLFFRSDSTT